MSVELNKNFRKIQAIRVDYRPHRVWSAGRPSVDAKVEDFVVVPQEVSTTEDAALVETIESENVSF
jgi:hypothetical protein